MQRGEGSRASRIEGVALVAPLALAVLGYARALRGELLFDDLEVLDSPAARSFGAWLRGALLPGTLVAGRPLTTLTFAANHAAGALDPLGYHLVNLALHLSTVVLVGLLARRVADLAGAPRPRRIALAVAGLFAVHPLQTEAVSYVAQRSEVLASALYVGALLLLLAAGAREGRGRWGWWAAALAAFALGLAAKPIVLTVPAALLAIRLAAAPPAPGEPRGRWRGAAAALVPIAAAAGAFAWVLLAALRGRTDAGFSVPGTSAWLYLLTQARASLVYLRLLLWPAGQSVDWQLPTSPGLGDPATLAAVLAVLAIAAGGVVLLVRGRGRGTPDGAAARLAGLGVLWWFLVLSPTSSLVPLADALAEHRAYLASWGVFLAVVAGADALAARLGAARGAAVAWTAAILALSVALHRRNAVWESREALWTDALAKTPTSARARVGLGEAYDAQGRTAEAIREYELALAHAGANVARRAKILRALGAAQLSAGRPEEARRSFAEGLHFLPGDGGLLAQAALAAHAGGDEQAAEAFARRAVAANPGEATAWIVAGYLRLEREDWPGALSAYDRAVALEPDRGEAHYGRALALQALGRPGEECAARRAALRGRLNPDHRAPMQAELAARCR